MSGPLAAPIGHLHVLLHGQADRAALGQGVTRLLQEHEVSRGFEGLRRRGEAEHEQRCKDQDDSRNDQEEDPHFR
jgi:hypothetical protein